MAERTVFVFAYLPDSLEAVPAGELTIVEDGPRLVGCRFVYGNRYMVRDKALEVDPVSLRFRDIKRAPGEAIDPVNDLPLFGALVDAGPDAWGRRVIESALRAPPNGLSEADYLVHAGSHRVGALDVRPTLDGVPLGLPSLSVGSLERMVEAASRLDAGETISQGLLQFLQPGGSLGGARPKSMLEHEGNQWIAKFSSRNDPFNVPRIEYATLKLALRVGLDVSALKLQELSDQRDVLMVRRFDRTWNGSGFVRHHYVSALTLLGRHESESINGSYMEIAAAIRKFGDPKSIAENNRELFGRMVFNIVVNNNDDHLKNHGFLWNGKGFVLSPLFDVVPMPEIATERTLHLSVGTAGRIATLDNALSKHAAFDLTLPDAVERIEQIVGVVREWKGYFEEDGVAGRDIQAVEAAFRRASDIGIEQVRRSLIRPTNRS